MLAITSLVVGFQQDSGLDFSITSVITTQALHLLFGKEREMLCSRLISLSHLRLCGPSMLLTPSAAALWHPSGTPLAALWQPIKRYHKHLTQIETEEIEPRPPHRPVCL